MLLDEMKKIAIVVIALALLVSAVAGRHSVEVAEANPIAYGRPNITIYSPQMGHTYNSSEVLLSVGIQLFGYTYSSVELISQARYSLDYGVTDPLNLAVPSEIAPGTLINATNILPNLSDGNHSVTIYLLTTFGESANSTAPFTIDTSLPPSGSPIQQSSIPEFTVKFVNVSYSMTTTNPYTGMNETQLVNNNSVEFTIKNQLFGNSGNIYFNIRTKPHFAEDWTEVYPLQNRTSSYDGKGTFYYALYISPDSPKQSNSEYTTLSFPVVPTELYGASGYDIQRYYPGYEGEEGRVFAFLSAVPSDGVLDFQVETLAGHNAERWVIEHPFYPTIGGHSTSAVAYDSTSGWSGTQSITIGENASASPTPTFPSNHSPSPTLLDSPTQQPAQTSFALPTVHGPPTNFITLPVLVGIIMTVTVLAIVIGGAIYLRRLNKKKS